MEEAVSSFRRQLTPNQLAELMHLRSVLEGDCEVEIFPSNNSSNVNAESTSSSRKSFTASIGNNNSVNHGGGATALSNKEKTRGDSSKDNDDKKIDATISSSRGNNKQEDGVQNKDNNSLREGLLKQLELARGIRQRLEKSWKELRGKISVETALKDLDDSKDTDDVFISVKDRQLEARRILEEHKADLLRLVALTEAINSDTGTNACKEPHHNAIFKSYDHHAKRFLDEEQKAILYVQEQQEKLKQSAKSDGANKAVELPTTESTITTKDDPRSDKPNDAAACAKGPTSSSASVPAPFDENHSTESQASSVPSPVATSSLVATHEETDIMTNPSSPIHRKDVGDDQPSLGDEPEKIAVASAIDDKTSSVSIVIATPADTSLTNNESTKRKAGALQREVIDIMNDDDNGDDDEDDAAPPPKKRAALDAKAEGGDDDSGILILNGNQQEDRQFPLILSVNSTDTSVTPSVAETVTMANTSHSKGY